MPGWERYVKRFKIFDTWEVTTDNLCYLTVWWLLWNSYCLGKPTFYQTSLITSISSAPRKVVPYALLFYRDSLLWFGASDIDKGDELPKKPDLGQLGQYYVSFQGTLSMNITHFCIWLVRNKPWNYDVITMVSDWISTCLMMCACDQ